MSAIGCRRDRLGRNLPDLAMGGGGRVDDRRQHLEDMDSAGLKPFPSKRFTGPLTIS